MIDGQTDTHTDAGNNTRKTKLASGNKSAHITSFGVSFRKYAYLT